MAMAMYCHTASSLSAEVASGGCCDPLSPDTWDVGGAKAELELWAGPGKESSAAQLPCEL